MSEQLPPPRSAGALTQRRVQQPWPSDREFRILSIDGGGIKGIFPSCVLAELEDRYLGGEGIASCFDLITGTSTGGIVALGLASGMRAREIADLYINRGNEIFPPYADNWWGRQRSRLDWVRNFALHRYDRAALTALVSETFGDRLLGASQSRLCIPSIDGRHGTVYVFKTPHHPDYRRDQHELMTTVACATSAAPTYFKPLQSNGYRFVDGGLWANNPIMVGLVDALACFDVDRHNVRILSLGCGDEPYTVTERMLRWGGLFTWRTVIDGALAFQSENALGQAKLLIGAERVLRVTPTAVKPPIGLDDWRRAKDFLPGEAIRISADLGSTIEEKFLRR